MPERPAAAGADVIESPAPRTRLPLRILLALAVVAAAVAVVVARREDPPPPPPPPRVPTLAGWPPAGPRADDQPLRETAWRAWAERDVSVRLDRTSVLYAGDWPEAAATVVVLANDQSDPPRLAMFVVENGRARRYSQRPLTPEVPYYTEVVEVAGRRAMVAIAPGARAATVTTARVGGVRARNATHRVVDGLLVPVEDGWFPTRVRLRAFDGTVLVDAVPGADLNPPGTPPLPLILSERVQGTRRVQQRGNRVDVLCEVTLADPESGAPMLVYCSGTA